MGNERPKIEKSPIDNYEIYCDPDASSFEHKIPLGFFPWIWKLMEAYEREEKQISDII